MAAELVDLFRRARSVRFENNKAVLTLGGKRAVVVGAASVAKQLIEYLERERGVELDDNARAAIVCALMATYNAGWSEGCDACIEEEELLDGE